MLVVGVSVKRAWDSYLLKILITRESLSSRGGIHEKDNNNKIAFPIYL